MDESTHKRFCTIASDIRATESTLRNKVSSHTLCDSVSFANLEYVRKYMPQDQKNNKDTLTDYIATFGTDLVLSIRQGPTEEPKEAGAPHKEQKKRKRDSCEWTSQMFDLVTDAIERIKKAHPSVPQLDLDEARSVLSRIVNCLKGAANEELVQSFGIFRKQLRPSDASFALLIAVRLNSGVAVSISKLKKLLGRCWEDGVVTSQDNALGIGSVDLPLSSEGKTAKAHGNLPMLIVTPVQHVKEEAVAPSATLTLATGTKADSSNA